MLAELIQPDGANPGGREILRRFAPDLYDHNDPMFGHRLSSEPVTRPDEPAWQPPVSAVSVATASLRPPPPPSAPSTTLGDSAAQSVPLQRPPRKSRAGLYAALGTVMVAAIVIGAVSLSGGGTSKPTDKDSAAMPVSSGTAPTVATSVAVLTTPVGAAVFIDDELVGTSPTKVQLAPGRSVRVRAELAGHESEETTHVVGERAETVRLTLTPPIDTAVPIDAGVDAVPATSRTGSGRRPGGGRRTPGADGASAAGASGSGAATAKPFDPEGIAR